MKNVQNMFILNTVVIPSRMVLIFVIFSFRKTKCMSRVHNICFYDPKNVSMEIVWIFPLAGWKVDSLAAKRAIFGPKTKCFAGQDTRPGQGNANGGVTGEYGNMLVAMQMQTMHCPRDSMPTYALTANRNIHRYTGVRNFPKSGKWEIGGRDV